MELVKVTVKFARDLVRQIESERAEREEIENPRHPAPAKMTVTKDVSRRNRAKYERKVVENAVGDGKRVEETLRVVFLRPKITEEVQNNALKYTQPVKMAPKNDNASLFKQVKTGPKHFK